MTTLEVSSAVHAILEAFANCMHISERIRGRKSKKHGRLQRADQEDLKLHDSLQNRPREIKAEYAQSVVKHGKRFEEGDNKAYSSLAHVLLVLNTGLISLINNALSLDVKEKSKSRQSLLILSESAAMNTMNALVELDARLSRPALNRLPRKEQRSQDTKYQSSKMSPSAKDVQTKRPPPNPLLARGGWVRSKSGSSIITVSSAKRNTTKEIDHKRSKSVPIGAMTKTCVTTSTAIPKDSSISTTEERLCTCRPSPRLPSQDVIEEEFEQELPAYIERPPSMLIVPADYFDSFNFEQSKATTPPPRPPKIPLHLRSNVRVRPRPTSAATFLTTSTKIGEIPEHKWADRVITEEEQQDRPLPYVIPPPLEPVRKKGRGFRFWKKPQNHTTMVAH